MKYEAIRKELSTKEEFSNQCYRNFKGIDFKVIDNLPAGEFMNFEINEPTYIKQSTGNIHIKAYAPTIINGCTGMILVNSYAPLLIKGSTQDIYVCLRANTIIELSTGDTNIKAAPYLELVGNNIPCFNQKYNNWGSVKVKSNKQKKGTIMIDGSSGTSGLNFEHSKFNLSDFKEDRTNLDKTIWKLMFNL